MFDATQIIVGLEIGTSKICAAVAEAGAQGELTILGLGQCKSRGVRKGELIDVTKAAEDIRTALVAAEEMANVEINSVFLGVSGNHIRSVNSRGILPIATAHRPITALDIEDAVARARQLNCPAGYEVIDSIRQDFRVDDQPGIPNPVGFVGGLLEASVHVIQAKTSRIETAKTLLADMQLTVVKPVFTGLASALAVLTPEQKEEGVIVIDLGAGVTNYAYFQGSVLRHSGVLAVGGDHVTNDLACALKIPLEEAETIKLHPELSLESGAPAKTQTIELPGDQLRAGRTLSVEKLQRILSLRVEELLEIVAEDLAPSGAFGGAREVVLCGGGARAKGLEKTVQRILQLPVTIGCSQLFSGPADVLGNPEFACAIGLTRYGSMKLKRRQRGSGGLRATFANFFGRSA
jgi:cell division protein FtsA